MGKCWSSDLSYRVLRESVIGSLITSDHEFDQFHQICRTEMHTISSSLSALPTQAFYVVVAGEVVVNLSDGDSKPIAVNVYQAGDVIFFFRTDTISHGSLVYEKLKLTLQFRSKDSMSFATVIGADYQSLDKFLVEHAHLTALQSFCSLKWSDFMGCPIFESLRAEQLNMLGPLLKIKISKAGQVLSFANKAPKIVESKSQKSHKSAVDSPVLFTATNHSGIILTGRCLVVPSWVDLGTVTTALAATGSSAKHSTHNPVTRRHSVLGSIMNAVGLNITPEEYLAQDEYLPANYLSNLASKLQNEVTQIFPGSMFGLENFFAQNSNMGLDSIVALDNAIIGYIDYETLQLFSQREKRFKRVVQRNFFKGLLNTVRPLVPMLADLDEKHYALLASLVSLKFVTKHEKIYDEGDPSDSSYIVIRGMVKEAEFLESTVHFGNRPTPVNHMEHLHQSRLLGYGSLFGEVSLVTDTPYFNSTYAIEPSALLCINKHTFERIYNKNKSKLAEIRIRLVGVDVELQHILNHPKCNKHFTDYLKKQVAVENILFLNAVAKFDDMTERLKKEMWKVMHQYANDSIHTQQQLHTRKPSISSSGRVVLSTLPNMATETGLLRSSLIKTADNSQEEVLPVRHHSAFMRESFLRHITNEIDTTAEAIVNSTTNGSPEKLAALTNGEVPGTLIPKKNSMIFLDTLGDASSSMAVDEEEAGLTGSKRDSQRANETETETATGNAALTLRGTKGTSTTIPAKQLTDITESSNCSPETEEKAVSPLKKTSNGAPEIPNMLIQYQRKFEKNLLELKEVAKNIMEKYIYLNGEYEVNIPQKMKFKTISDFEQSMKLSVDHCMEALYDAICTAKLIEQTIEQNEINHVDSTIGIHNTVDTYHQHHGLAGRGGPHSPSSTVRHKVHVPPPDDSPVATLSSKHGAGAAVANTSTGYEEIELWTIFEQSKTEIFKLVNNDCFMRWKTTPEYKTLIKSFQPYDGAHMNRTTSTIGGGGGAGGDDARGLARQSFDGSVYSLGSALQNANEFQHDLMSNNSAVKGIGGGYNHRRPMGNKASIYEVPLKEMDRANSTDSLHVSEDGAEEEETGKEVNNKKGLVGLKGIFQKKPKGVAISG